LEATTQEFYSVKQVAKRLGVSKLTIQRRIADGKIKAFRTNGDSGPYRISQEALDEYMRYREEFPHGAPGYRAEVE
jgi:excisionase family DNA binding protein